MEYQLLDPKISELTDKQGIFAAAIDGVDRAEFLEQPSGTAKFAEDSAVQAHLQDLTGRYQNHSRDWNWRRRGRDLLPY